ncbi:uncharacterized protein KIAA1143 homolog [Callorhinchus milii]|nr:uncharacterized protein KIAA1143 homolog [Callorhinchus milii]|eukprot:gi/632967232/ref/XP_007899865.1/ PREDICTED: uncharacterized protein KIAA1143 homolog [Callorhinchus milii]
MSKRKSGGVSYVKPAEPAFLRRFKQEVGFKEGPTVETKRQQLPEDNDSGQSDGDDEQPQVVVIKQGDLTAEEAAKAKLAESSNKKSEEPEPEDGKIVFRKPAKRSSEDKFTGLTATSSKKKKEEQKEWTDSKDSESRPKQVKNSSLLSFGDDEDDD